MEIHLGHHLSIGRIKTSFDLEVKLLDFLLRIKRLAYINLGRINRKSDLLCPADTIKEAFPNPCFPLFVSRLGTNSDQFCALLKVAPFFMKEFFHIGSIASQRAETRRLDRFQENVFFLFFRREK